jgi:hypothetical protein
MPVELGTGLPVGHGAGERHLADDDDAFSHAQITMPK